MGLRDYIYKTIKATNSLALFLMFLILFLQVFTRKILSSPLTWPEEISLVLMIWVTFLGAYQCTVSGGHLKMDMLEDKIPESIRPYFRVFASMIIVFFLGVVLYHGVSFIQQAGVTKMPISGLPMYVPYGIIWISLFLMFFETILGIFHELLKTREKSTSKEIK